MSTRQFTKTIARDGDFDSTVLSSPVTAIVEFGATWCGPCKALAPIVDKIGQDYQGKAQTFYVDIDDCTEVTKKYGVKSVPTVIVFQGGQKMGTHAGLTSRENLLRLAGL